MPLVGFICPIEREKVPFDHFDHCTARRGVSPVPPWLARFLGERAGLDVRHSGMNLTVTRCLTCPRQTAIETTLPYYLDPTSAMTRERGSALHVMAANNYNPEVYFTEKTDPVRMAVHGTLFNGVNLSGQIDALRRDFRELVDNKFPLDWSVAWRSKDGRPKADYEAQMNMLRLLLAQQDWAIAEGFDPEGILMVVWDHGIGKSEGPAPLLARHMTEEQILASKPGADREPFLSQAYTVEEIVAVHEYARVELEKATTPQEKERVIAALPLVGKFMYSGKKCESYCDVKSDCDRLVREYGEPMNPEEEAALIGDDPDAE